METNRTGNKLALTVTVARSILMDLSNLFRALVTKESAEEIPMSQDPIKAPLAGLLNRWRRLSTFINENHETMRFTDYIYAEANARCANELGRVLERLPRTWSESQMQAAVNDEVFFICELCKSVRSMDMMSAVLNKRLSQLKGELR
jgi:hypothetical protein